MTDEQDIVERKPASPELIARGLNLIAAHFSISDYQRDWNVRGWPSMSATESEALSEVASEAASLIERLRREVEEADDTLGKLDTLLGDLIKERDGPHRVKVEGEWQEGPLATAFVKAMIDTRVIVQAARQSLAKEARHD